MESIITDFFTITKYQFYFLHPFALPFFILFTLLFVFILTKIIFHVSNITKSQYSSDICVSVTIISIVLFLLEGIFIQIFAIATNRILKAFGVNWLFEDIAMDTFGNPVSFIFTALSIAFCAFLSYKLNLRFSKKYLFLSPEDSKRIILKISIFTAPIIYIIPIEAILVILFFF